MRVRVKLFAFLGRYASDAPPGTPFDLELPAGTTVDALIEQLKLPRDEVKVIFVNGRSRSPEWLLVDGDDLGIFPPIAGG